MKTEYRIIGRFRKDEKPHVVDSDRKWTLEDAQKRLMELETTAKLEIERKQRKASACGSFSVSTPYYSEYDLLDLGIQVRQVSPWENF